MLSFGASIVGVNSKQKKTLAAVFALPTSASILFADIESFLKALGASVVEREGARVKVVIQGEQWRAHRPHPAKEARRFQIEEVRELLERIGIKP